MFGKRDAGAIGESCYVDCLVGMGFNQGKGSPCCFEHPEWKVSVVVHGDDFTALGTDQALDKYEEGLRKSFECKMRGSLGEEAHDMKEIQLLNRIIPITPVGLMYEADPRHAELLAKAINLGTCKHVATPGVKKGFVDDIMDQPVGDEYENVNVIGQICERMPLVRFAEGLDEI